MEADPLNGSHPVIQTAQVCRRTFIYRRSRYRSGFPMAHGRRRSDFARAFSKALGLPRTAALIIAALARARKALGVGEIVRRVRSSERSVRENLQILLRPGTLVRQVLHTAHAEPASS